MGREHKSESQTTSPHRRTHGWIAALLVLMLWGAVLILSRTAGFKAQVLNALNDRTGLEFTADRVRITPIGLLTIEGLESEQKAAQQPICQIGRIQAGWSALYAATGQYAYRIVISGMEWRIPANVPAQTDPPEWYERLSNRCRLTGLFPSLITGEEPRGLRTRAVRGKARLDITDSALEWVAPNGDRLAAAYGISLDWTPLKSASKRMVHARLQCARYREPGMPFTPRRREFIIDERKTVVMEHGR